MRAKEGEPSGTRTTVRSGLAQLNDQTKAQTSTANDMRSKGFLPGSRSGRACRGLWAEAPRLTAGFYRVPIAKRSGPRNARPMPSRASVEGALARRYAYSGSRTQNSFPSGSCKTE